jgi:hypothetical protein
MRRDIDKLIDKRNAGIEVSKKYENLNNHTLLSSLKPLLEYFSNKDLQDYCKSIRITNKNLYKRNKNVFEYRGYKIKYIDFYPHNEIGLNEFVYCNGFMQYLTKTCHREVVMGKLKDNFQYTIHFFTFVSTRKQMKKTIDAIIKQI